MKKLSGFLFLLSALVCSGQSNIFPIKSIAQNDTDFSDLVCLDQPLTGVKIVALGEQSHGDGATFDGKIRLIKYLHEKLGFDIIAFESGWYDCYRANKLIKEGKDSSVSALPDALFGIWRTTELQGLAQYVQETQTSAHPLLVAGFDCQFSGKVRIKRPYFINDYMAAVKNIESRYNVKLLTDSADLVQAFYKEIKYSNTYIKPSYSDTLVLYNNLSGLLALTPQENDTEILFWQTIARNIETDYRRKYNMKSDNLRDSVMALNVLSLQRLFPNKKIVLWAANMHVAYNLHLAKETYTQKVTSMGDYLHSKLQGDYYPILFTSYEGKAKAGFINLKIKTANSSNSIENYLNAKNSDFLFVNFRNAPAQIPEENRQSTSVFGHANVLVDISQITDGLFFIKQMYPCHL
jgi:erythromycin esterase